MTGSTLSTLAILMALVGCASADTLADCTNDPTLSQCADVDTYYSPALVREDINTLCGTGGMGSMAWMSGCTIKRLCDGNKVIASKYCNEWSLLTNICSTQYGEMMSGMGGCRKYTQICVSGTAAVKCSSATFAGIPDLIPTRNALTQANAVCNGNTNNACSACTSSLAPDCSDPLSTLSTVCKNMASSSMCADYKKMCDANGNDLGELCGTTNSGSALRGSALAVLLATAVAFFMA